MERFVLKERFLTLISANGTIIMSVTNMPSVNMTVRRENATGIITENIMTALKESMITD